MRAAMSARSWARMRSSLSLSRSCASRQTQGPTMRKIATSKPVGATREPRLSFPETVVANRAAPSTITVEPTMSRCFERRSSRWRPDWIT